MTSTDQIIKDMISTNQLLKDNYISSIKNDNEHLNRYYKELHAVNKNILESIAKRDRVMNLILMEYEDYKDLYDSEIELLEYEEEKKNIIERLRYYTDKIDYEVINLRKY
jgi:hypothetical protein